MDSTRTKLALLYLVMPVVIAGDIFKDLVPVLLGLPAHAPPVMESVPPIYVWLTLTAFLLPAASATLIVLSKAKAVRFFMFALAAIFLAYHAYHTYAEFAEGVPPQSQVALTAVFITQALITWVSWKWLREP